MGEIIVTFFSSTCEECEAQQGVSPKPANGPVSVSVVQEVNPRSIYQMNQFNKLVVQQD